MDNLPVTASVFLNNIDAYFASDEHAQILAMMAPNLRGPFEARLRSMFEGMAQGNNPPDTTIVNGGTYDEQ